jgi:hypothetical protein
MYPEPLPLPSSAPAAKRMDSFVGVDVTKEFSGNQFFNGKVVSCDGDWFQVKTGHTTRDGSPSVTTKHQLFIICSD